MFWDKWIPKKYLVKSEICAVEIAFSDAATIFHYTHLKNKNNKLEVVYTGTSEKLEFQKNIEKNKIPVLIIANGKGIVLKKISLAENTEQNFDELVRSNLPTINTTDFFVQLFKTSETTAFIALCRKEQLNAVLEELKNKKIEIANLLIGATAIAGLKPLWSDFNSIPTTFHVLELTNNEIDTISPVSNEVSKLKIDDIELNSLYTLGFAVGLSYLTQNKIADTNAQELLEIEHKHLDKNKFRILTICCVAIAFVLAITNVVFYTNYFDKNNKLETELSVYQGKYEQINNLLSDYQQKKDLIENAGILNKNKLSEYADRIGGTIPSEVALTELYFNPKNEEIESEDSLITFYNKQLVLKGNCNKSMIINDWVNVLKMQKFVKDVSLEKFSYNNEGILPNFEIKIVTE